MACTLRPMPLTTRNVNVPTSVDSGVHRHRSDGLLHLKIDCLFDEQPYTLNLKIQRKVTIGELYHFIYRAYIVCSTVMAKELTSSFLGYRASLQRRGFPLV